VNTTVAEDLQHRIHTGIPLSQAMGFRITALADTRITVEAPLDRNTNVHGTGFAGSLYALGILTAWGLASHLIATGGLVAELVVAEANIRYRAPLRADIVCHCSAAEGEASGFIDALAAQGRARLVLEVIIGDAPAAVLHAVMHASRA
jgi:thioesterase domain-containing protein